MGWLEWCKKQYPTVYEWKPEGCKLLPPTEDFIARVSKQAFLKTTPWGDVENCAIGGMNPHGHGKITKARNVVVFDIPFWIVKFLVFDRDKKCQDCKLAPCFEDGTPYSFDPDPKNFSAGLEAHHIIRFSDGGSNCTHNVALLCDRCHKRRKGRGGAPKDVAQAQL